MSSLTSICNPIQMFEEGYNEYLSNQSSYENNMIFYVSQIEKIKELKGCLENEISKGLDKTITINGHVYSLPASRPGYYLLLHHILRNYESFDIYKLNYTIYLLFYLEQEAATGLISVFKKTDTYETINNLRKTHKDKLLLRHGEIGLQIFNSDSNKYENRLRRPVYTISNTDVRMFLESYIQSLIQHGGKKIKIKKTKNTKKKKTKRKHRKRKTFKKKTNKRK
jgi:hypothetical protein